MNEADSPVQTKRFTGWQLAFFVLLAVVLAVMLTALIGYRMLFPGEFSPARLSAGEQQVLQAKLQRLEGLPGSGQDADALAPEAYSEAGASRALNFTERELNSLLASSPEMAQRLAIDLADNLASARLLVPVPTDFPVLGGKTVQVNAGLELAYSNGRPLVVLQGVSLWGVPIPNAWLGGMKNVDLVSEFGKGQGFWQAFADGIESIEIRDGEVQIVLKE